MAAASKAIKGSWLAVYGGGELEYRAAGRGAYDFDLCGMSRFGRRALEPGDIQCSLRRATQDLAGVGASIERSVDDRLVTTIAEALLACRDRLAFGALLRSAAAQSQRAVLRQTSPGDDEVSCLRHGLDRAVRAALYPGSDVGAASRNVGGSFAASAGANSQNWPENQICDAGSRVLQRAGDHVAAKPRAAVPHARHVPWTPLPEASPGNRTALDQAPKSRLVPALVEKQEKASHGVRMRDLSYASQSQRSQARPTEAAVRRLAREGLTGGDSTLGCEAVRHALGA